MRSNPAGIITTVAGNGIPGFGGDGGPARNATLSAPTQLDFDAQGALLFTDRGNGRVRRIAPGDSPPPAARGCGAVLTKDTTLHADVGPCPADGLIVGADDITLNLNGHTVSGTGPGDGSHAGILITNHTGVIVNGRQGTVTEFAEGVAVVGGSHNTVKFLTVRDNVGPPTTDAVFGDGIGVFFSAANTIANNTVTHNGIYTGVAILGPDSNDNVIQNNVISDTVDTTPGTFNMNGAGIVINAFLNTDFPRMVSISGNKVIANVVENNDNSGISNISNVNGIVAGNTVRGNGRSATESPRNGIGISHLDRAQFDTHMLVEKNRVFDKPRRGWHPGRR
ncbi:MAG: hypothetical protein ACR2LJ_08155 [Acidimicrobiales bacterium]